MCGAQKESGGGKQADKSGIRQAGKPDYFTPDKIVPAPVGQSVPPAEKKHNAPNGENEAGGITLAKVFKKAGEEIADALVMGLLPVAAVSFGCSPGFIGARQIGEDEEDAGSGGESGKPGGFHPGMKDGGVNGDADAGEVHDSGAPGTAEDAGSGADSGIAEGELMWWPGYLLQVSTGDAGLSEEVVNVSLGLTTEAAGPDMPAGTDLWGVSGGYPSEAEIPDSAREEGAETLLGVLAFSKFFLREDAYAQIAPNNVFIVSNASSVGGKYLGSAYGFRMKGAGGDAMACCFEGCGESGLSTCGDYDTVMLKASGGKVVFHELLHDAWHSALGEGGRAEFAGNAELFFNVLGSTWQSDQLVGAIWNAHYHSPEDTSVLVTVDGLAANLGGADLDNWVAANPGGILDGLGDSEKTRVKNAVSKYFEIQSTVTGSRTIGMAEEQRDSFIATEGFAYMAANYPLLQGLYEEGGSSETRLLPFFMGGTYEGIIKEEYLEQLTYKGYGYYTSASAFSNFSQYVVSFADYMKEQYPALAEISE